MTTRRTALGFIGSLAAIIGVDESGNANAKSSAMPNYLALDHVTVKVKGGNCRLRFRPGSCTGERDSDTYPGVGFDMVDESREKAGLHNLGVGVIGRRDAEKLRDMLDAFLLAERRWSGK